MRPLQFFNLMSKYKNLIPHPDVISHSYHGIVVRFRKVDDDVYIPVTDARTLLNLGSGTLPIYTMCWTVAKIEFYKNGNALTAIQPCDLENLAKRGVRATIFPDQQQRIAWMREICKQIKEAEARPEVALKIFDSPEFGQIRTQIYEGEPVFCLADVCKAIDISNSRNVKARLDSEDVHAIDTLTPKGNQSITYINESGLYDTILRSESPKAKPFRKWVTKEVLPSIRKTGGYVAVTPDDTPEIVMARGLMAAQEALNRMEKRAVEAEHNLLIAQPKADYYDAVITERELFSTTQIAAELGMSYQTLRTRLFELGIVTAAKGLLLVTPENRMLGEEDSPNVRPSRSAFKWNLEGRNKIFELIAPTMPK